MTEFSYKETIEAVKNISACMAMSKPFQAKHAYEVITLSDEFKPISPLDERFEEDVNKGDWVTPYGITIGDGCVPMIIFKTTSPLKLNSGVFMMTHLDVFFENYPEWIEEVADLSKTDPAFRLGLLWGKLVGKSALQKAAESELTDHILTVCREIRDEQASLERAARLDTDPTWGIF